MVDQHTAKAFDVDLQDLARMVAEIEWWREAPLWDEQSIAGATRTWFRYLGDAQREAG